MGAARRAFFALLSSDWADEVLWESAPRCRLCELSAAIQRSRRRRRPRRVRKDSSDLFGPTSLPNLLPDPLLPSPSPPAAAESHVSRRTLISRKVDALSASSPVVRAPIHQTTSFQGGTRPHQHLTSTQTRSKASNPDSCAAQHSAGAGRTHRISHEQRGSERTTHHRRPVHRLPLPILAHFLTLDDLSPRIVLTTTREQPPKAPNLARRQQQARLDRKSVV